MEFATNLKCILIALLVCFADKPQGLLLLFDRGGSFCILGKKNGEKYHRICDGTLNQSRKKAIERRIIRWKIKR